MQSFQLQDKRNMKQGNRKRNCIASALLASLCSGAFAPNLLGQNIPGAGFTPNYGTGGAYSAPPPNNAPYYLNSQPPNTTPNFGPAPINGQMTVGQPSFGSSGQVYPEAQPYPGQFQGQPVPGPVLVGPATNYPVAGQPMGGPPAGALPQFPSAVNPSAPALSDPWKFETSGGSPYNPRMRDVPVEVIVQEGQTGRFSVGGSVNSDLGLAGQIILEERNFDIMKWPGRPSDLLNGAFRGAGQNFRLELVPGTSVQRYTLSWTEPNLFGYSPFSLSVGGFYFTRIYRDWTEKRLGGRVALGYEITPDLSLTTELRAEDVEISKPRVLGVAPLDRVLGSNDLYTGRVRLAHNTRDSPFLPTEGHLLELIYDQTFGEFDYPRGQVNWSRYFLVRQRADGSGRHTFTSSIRLGFSGADTPLFENFFAGGFSTMRGFQFRGASPVLSDVQVGGRFQFLGSFEYMMPVTADDMLRMVAFVDYGTIERDIEINSKNFRVAPGLGARIAVPALGPAPLAFDFAFQIAYADTDTRQVFSFTMGLTR